MINYAKNFLLRDLILVKNKAFIELYTQRIKERNFIEYLLGSIRLRPHRQKLHRLRSPELRLSRLRLPGLRPSKLCPIG